MRRLNEAELIDYAQGNIENAARRREIEAYIQSSEKTQRWLETYRALQQAAGEVVNPSAQSIPAYQTPDFLKRAMDAQKHTSAWWTPFAVIWNRPVIAGATILVLLIGGMFLVSNPFSPTVRQTELEISDIPHHVWGAIVSPEDLQRIENSALDSPQFERHLGFLSPDLVAVLQRPASNKRFWRALSDALTPLKITMPKSLQTLVIDAELFSAIQAHQVIDDQEVWIYFYCGEILLIQPIK
jgi:hypothetical protein